MRILILDNFDSFTHNLYHYFCQLCEEVVVKRNDDISLAEIRDYTHIVVSPGPGLPMDAGITMDLLKMYFSDKPILGVCLGCQALAELTGARLFNQDHVAHGIQRIFSREAEESWLLHDIPKQFKVGLYHSWAIERESLGDDWKICGSSKDRVVMAIEHKSLPVAGVQFHPESIMTEYGMEILSNWLSRTAKEA